MNTRYEVRLHRIGRWWALDIPALAIHSQCRTLDEAEDVARNAITDAVGIPSGLIDLDLLVPEMAWLLQGIAEARRRRAAAAAEEERTVADAVRALVEDLCVSQGDACRLLGVSPDEVARLTPARRSVDPRPRHSDPVPSANSGSPTRGFRGSGGTRALSGYQRPRPALPRGSFDGS
ncbi:hypothetical protein ACFOSC_01035 [Streptantibioticus rubrisoli]|uniref:HicB family protein n=1 Tax=Streptantibioticus rubrisoli TaxID=1387313 RepID=A0ABT1PG61_9ACTN|nr:hypothetical protein [Streptantibioticus rubrisoli]MCQ4043290.1 hypothetical protein [Streptantibioticus rubrisoli]